MRIGRRSVDSRGRDYVEWPPVPRNRKQIFFQN